MGTVRVPYSAERKGVEKTLKGQTEKRRR